MKVVFAIVIAGALSGGFVHAAEDQATWAARVNALSKPAADEVVFTAAGDAIWNRKISDNPDPRLQSLFEVMRASDIAFLNFEQVMADSGYPTIKEISRADPAMISEFSWAGVDLVSIANNHLMDFGRTGLETTLKVLDQAGIAHSGAGLDVAQAIRPAVIEKKGLKVALISLLVSPQFPEIGTAAEDAAPGVAPIHGTRIRMLNGKSGFAPWEADLARMEAAIKAARAAADVVAVSMHIHWGTLEEIDAEGKQLITRAAIDAGADMVLGHGPHVVNGIEFYKGKPIFYSLGNFAFQFDPAHYTFFPATQSVLKRLMANDRLWEAMMARIVFSRKGEFRRIELLPITLTKQGDPSFDAGEKAMAIRDRVTAMSAAFATKVRAEGWYATVDIPKGKTR